MTAAGQVPINIFFENIQDAILGDKNGTMGCKVIRWSGNSSPVWISLQLSKYCFSHGEKRATHDAVGQTRSDSRVLNLARFRMIAKGITFGAIEELTNNSVPHTCFLVLSFIACFYSFYSPGWIKFPSSNKEVSFQNKDSLLSGRAESLFWQYQGMAGGDKDQDNERFATRSQQLIDHFCKFSTLSSLSTTSNLKSKINPIDT